MPDANGNDPGYFQDAERDIKERDVEKDGGKGSKSKQSSKAKDLSHVPCKFFKVGACTAGSSCPFSHNLQEPGAQKEVCAWYVKGNCKFGHKCALAHILPGQSMSMDRKNKKAAQVAANAGGSGKEGGRSGRSQKKDTQSNMASGGSPSVSNPQIRNPLLPGSTAPTRVLPSSSSRPPLSMSLKATISPSAPAPPLKDTDFASFGLPDESNKLAVAPAQGKASQSDPLPTSPDTHATEKVGAMYKTKPSPVSSPLPLSTPSAPHRLGPSHQFSPHFGPIGSPPRSVGSTGQSARINGLSPSTPPSHAGFVSSSPFSAPGTKSVFLTYDTEDFSSNFKTRSGIAASLGTNRAWNTDFGPVPSQVTNRVEFGSKLLGEEVAVEDEDLEDFLPSSLTDLLTPEERSRRMSRSNSGQPVTPVKRDSSSHRPNVDGPHHRYSRSVPATSFLPELKAIWADNNSVDPSPPAGGPFAIPGGGLGSGTPSSYKSSSGFGSQPFNEDAFSPPLLAPSNASAAFLPGLHHHYLNSKVGAHRPTSTNPRASGSTFHSSTNLGGEAPAFSANAFPSTGMALSPPQMNAFGHIPRFDNAPPDSLTSNRQVGRPIPGGNAEFGGDADERRNVLSPSTRALQAHAPGQSLPQGLAAGYSRIHALPPPMISSPSGLGALSPGQTSAFSPPRTNGHEAVDLQAVAISPNTRLDSMFSRLSYAPGAPPNPSSNTPATTGHVRSSSTVGAPGLMRNISGQSWQSQGPFSPLSGPVVAEDYDGVFSMDKE